MQFSPHTHKFTDLYLRGAQLWEEGEMFFIFQIEFLGHFGNEKNRGIEDIFFPLISGSTVRYFPNKLL